MGFVISSIMLGSFGALQGTVLTNRTLVEHDARLPRIDWWYDPAICAITDALSGSEHAPCRKIVMALASDWIWCQSDSVVANRMSIPPFAPLLQQLRSNTRWECKGSPAEVDSYWMWKCLFRPASQRKWYPQHPQEPRTGEAKRHLCVPWSCYLHLPTISSLSKPRSQIPRMCRSIGIISVIICR